MRIMKLTNLAFTLNHALDSGECVDMTVADARALIRSGSIFEHLSNGIRSFSITHLTESERLELLEEWQTFADVIDEHRKFGIDRGGLCMLLAYLIEGIQQRAMKAEP